MDNDKPFKTIEVIDSRTNQVCKIACMSCIRGHRTTSCGIPVCRTKIFWTVKRPGRPSNSCTCRYGATGGCKCVVARAACPHKSKKGEKRSGECRCDEIGRYCCLLEPDHWNALLSLQKPTADFFPSREALEAKQAALDQASLPPTPSYSTVTSPHTTNSIPSTPAPPGRIQPVPIIPNTYNGYPSMSSTLTPTLTPRFGMMGIGAPMGSQQNVPPDALAWQGQAPPAPREYNPLYIASQSERGSCCQASTPSVQGVQSPGLRVEQTFTQPHDLQDATLSQPFNDASTIVSMSQLSPAPYDFDKLRTEYFQHQFPNSICQNCGLSGCTCRNCPPIFQNFGTTSWAQCCGRKHARDVQPSPVPQKVPRTEKYAPAQGLHSQPVHDQPLLPDSFAESVAGFQVNSNQFDQGYPDITLPPSRAADFAAFDHFSPEFTITDGTDPLDITEFLMSDLDQSHPGLNTVSGVTEKREEEEEEEGGGEGGGCCCSMP